MGKDFQAYAAMWRTAFASPRELAWRDNWLVNGFCADCRYCCGPQDNDTPFPMALLPSQLRPDLAEDFFMLDATTAYMDGRGCKALGSCGCSLTREKRPVACGLFPLVLANGGLWLYSICPAVLAVPLADWMPLARKAADWLATLAKNDLRHISLDLPPATLADRYINLHLPLFHSHTDQETS